MTLGANRILCQNSWPIVVSLWVVSILRDLLSKCILGPASSSIRPLAASGQLVASQRFPWLPQRADGCSTLLGPDPIRGRSMAVEP